MIATITKIDHKLHQDPSTLDTLKDILNCINQAKNSNMTMDLTLQDLEERCRTRLLYSPTSHIERLTQDYLDIQ